MIGAGVRGSAYDDGSRLSKQTSSACRFGGVNHRAFLAARLVTSSLSLSGVSLLYAVSHLDLFNVLT